MATKVSLPTLMTLVDGDVVNHVVDDAREDSKEDGRVEDTESYGDQYRTEILERQVTRIDRPRSMITSVTLQVRNYIRNNNSSNNNSNNTDFESHEGYGNHRSKLCQSIGKHTFNIVSGIFVSIAATAIWTAVGIYFATNSDNTTNIETTTLNKGGDQNLTIFIVSDLANSNAIKTTTLTKAQGIP